MKNLPLHILLFLSTTTFGQPIFINHSSKNNNNKELYIGVENFIEIQGMNYAANRIKFSISHGEVSKFEINKYLILVSNEEPDTLTYYENDNLKLVEIYQVKVIPNVIARLANIEDTFVTINEIISNPFLAPVLPGCDYKHSFQIFSFNAKIINSRTDAVTTFNTSNGAFLTKALIQSISSLKSNDKILFESIRVISPDGVNLALPPLSVLIR